MPRWLLDRVGDHRGRTTLHETHKFSFGSRGGVRTDHDPFNYERVDLSRTLLRAFVIASAAAYVGLLHFAYANVVSPAFAYSGLVYMPASDGSLPLAMIVAVIPSGWLPIRVSRPSQVLLLMFYVLGYVPSVLIPYYVLGSGFSGAFPLTLAVAACFGLLLVMQRLRIPLLWTPVTTMRTFEYVIFGIALLLAGYIILAFGLRFELPNLADVYDVRAAYDLAVADSRAPFVAYVVDWSLFVANPFLAVLGLRSKRYPLVAIALALEILGYSITGYKSALLVLAFVVPLYFLLAERRRPVLGLGIALAPVAIIVLSLTWDQMTGSGLATSLFVRRTIIVPGELLANYFDFFTQNPTYALSQSILRFLGPSPYALDPAHLIGAVYFHDPGLDANANIWADGLANFGFAGMVASSLGLALLLIVFDAAASGRDLRVTGSIAGLMAFHLSNSALLTTILTHGLGFALLLVLLMPRQGEQTVRARAPTDRLDPQPRPAIDEREALAGN